VRRAIEQVAANAKSLRLWQLIKASGMPVYPLVILWGGSKNARPSDPLAIGETIVADGLQAVRCWIEEIKRQPRIAPSEVVNKLDHQLASYVARREENDPALLPPPSFDQGLHDLRRVVGRPVEHLWRIHSLDTALPTLVAHSSTSDRWPSRSRDGQHPRWRNRNRGKPSLASRDKSG
jgi:hypothetical protein